MIFLMEKNTLMISLGLLIWIWIIFFSAQPEKVQLFSDQYIQKIAESLLMGINSGMIKTLTIALSPECCGGWEKAESMLAKFFQFTEIQI